MPGKTTKTETAPKTSKTSKTAATPAKAAAAPAPKTPKTSSKKKEPVVEAVAPVVAEEVPAPAAASDVSAEFSGFMTKLQSLGTLISTLKSEFRTLEKKASRELKSAAKASSKKKRKTGNRSPSGFVKPTLISDELASFLGKSKGTEMARTEVTREINAYIRSNQLQDKTNGRRINADTKLSSLLKLASGEELTYFNLQRYMSPHFAKSAAPASA